MFFNLFNVYNVFNIYNVYNVYLAGSFTSIANADWNIYWASVQTVKQIFGLDGVKNHMFIYFTS